MRQVFLYGKLATEFGPSFTLRANTVGAAVKLLEANFPGKFFKNIMGGFYKVVAGKNPEDGNGIHFDNALVRSRLNLGSKDLHIIPVPEGSGGNIGRIVIGIALIAAAFYFAPAVVAGGAAGGAAGAGAAATGGLGATAFGIGSFAVTYNSIALFGISLVIGGVAGLLTPMPKVGDYGSRESPDSRASFIFNGAQNTTEQGGCVPVIYGRMKTGSTVISGGITTEQI